MPCQYNDRWPEEEWIAAHVTLALRYRRQPYVVASELRNEIRSAVVGQQRLQPTWGSGNKSDDWKLAASAAADAILKVRPEGLLIVVDSLAYSTDFSRVSASPLKLPVPGRLVYSAHDYSWSQPGNSSPPECTDQHLPVTSRQGLPQELGPEVGGGM